MERFKFLKRGDISEIPKTAGVYTFWDKKEVLYIGKAANLRERIKNHFSQPSYRDGLFLSHIKKIGYIETDSEIEALILEAKLIKKYQPRYNIVWRDDKNYFFVGITKENFPIVFLTHQTKNLKSKILNPKSVFIGPFVDGRALKQTLKILRKIFPYYTVKKHPKGPCPWCHLRLCPGPKPDKKEYQKNIKNLISVLKGKRKMVLLGLKREMKEASLSQNYEKAAKIRDQIEALEKVMSHAKIFNLQKNFNFLYNDWSEEKVWKNTEKILKKILKIKKGILRIEAYDVSNIQGDLATGSMVTFRNGKPDKNFYRRFKIKISGKPNDVAMLKEVIERRLRHTEWHYPDLILIDGGKPQLNVAVNSKSKNQNSKKIKVMAIAKRRNELYLENRKKPILLKSLPREIFNLILRLRDEAHRFAISYHKKLRLRELAPT